MRAARLRFFFDPGSGTCLWAGDEQTSARYGHAVTIRDLQLPANLAVRLEYLCAWYDTSLDWEDPGGPSPWSRDESERFRSVVESTVDDLRRALGGSVVIIDESSARPGT